MAITYDSIASVTVGSGGTGSIEFANIPGTYTDLLVKISGRATPTSSPDFIEMSINNSLSNFTSRRIQGNGAAVTSSSFINSYANIQTNETTASIFGNIELYIPNYAGSTNKSITVDAITENNGTTAYIGMWAWQWAQTSAITSLKFSIVNFMQHSTATLYGIKNTV